METRFYRVQVQVTNNKGRTYWHRIGSAVKTGKPGREIIECTIDSAPLSWNGKFSLFATVPGVPTNGKDGD